MEPEVAVRGEAPLRRYHVDGQVLATRAELPLRSAADHSPIDWTIRLERGGPEPDPLDVTWTGEAVQGAWRWGRFGRRGATRVVRLEGVFDLLADPTLGTARLIARSTHLPDAGVLRRALPYLAALKGQLVLHAAGVVLPEGAVLLCGAASTGKSTLALALDRTGTPVLGDDHVVVDGDTLRAHTSVPWIDTAQASRAAFAPSQARHAHKTSVPCRTARPDGPTPVVHVVFLTRGTGAPPHRLPQLEVVRRLLADVLFVGDPQDSQEHRARLQAAAHLARAVPAYEIDLPDGLGTLARALRGLRAQLRAPEGAEPPARHARRRAGSLDRAAVFWLGLARLAVWVLPLGPARRLLGWLSRVRGPVCGAAVDPHAVGRSVRRATRHVPRASCLPQALAAQALLARGGQEAQVHLGVKREPDGRMGGHAWVTVGGEVVVGGGPGEHVEVGRVGMARARRRAARPVEPPTPQAWIASWMRLLVRSEPQITRRIRAEWLTWSGGAWEPLADALIEQGLAARGYELLRELAEGAVPPAVLERLAQQRIAQTSWALTLLGLLEEVATRLEAARVPLIVLKGPVVARRLYGKATARRYTDIDLLVPPGRRRAAAGVLASLGFEAHFKALPRRRRAPMLAGTSLTFLDARGRTLDLHWGFEGPGLSFPLERTGVWRRRAWVDLRGRPYNVLGAEDELLYLCVHGGKHLWACWDWVADLAVYLERSRVVDASRLQVLARRTGATRMLHVGLLLAHDLAGARAPRAWLADAHADRGARDLARQLARLLETGRAGTLGPLRTLALAWRLRERPRDRVVGLVGTLIDAARPRFDGPTPPKHPVLGYVTRSAHLVRKYARRLRSKA